MIKKIITSFTFLFALLTYGQKSCNCAENLKFISAEIENNSASYADQVFESKRTSDYKKHKRQVIKLSKEAKTEKECFGVMQYYLSFLRDAHQKLYLTNDYYPFKSFDDSISVKRFITNNVEIFPIKNLDSKQLLGNWHYKDGTFALQIQNNQQKGRKYIGVLQNIVRHKNQFLGNRGDLKIEFYENYKKELYAIYWSFGQQPAAYKVEFADGVLKLGRSIVFYKNSSQIEKTTEVALVNSSFFEELSSKTNYLRINTFDFGNKKNIDSILSNNKEKFLSKDNLIIDIRNNGGGSDLSYYPILPYIMDKKIYESPIAATSIWVSKDNFQDYYNERYLYDVTTKQDSINADIEIKELQKHIGKFEPYVKTTSEIDSITTYPKKVYIIQNREVASSTEGFILTAQQSAKVKTFGENSGGFVSYGEWRKLEIPNLSGWVSMTQKKMIFYNDADFEMIGIKPDVELDANQENQWIDIVKNEIEK